MFNVLSLMTGIIAWIFGCMAITSKESRKSHGLSVASFSACGIALVSQLLEIGRRVLISDFAAIEDTIRAVIIAAMALVVVTTVLNVAALVNCK